MSQYEKAKKTIRVDPETFDKFAECAKIAGITQGEFLRLIMNALYNEPLDEFDHEQSDAVVPKLKSYFKANDAIIAELQNRVTELEEENAALEKDLAGAVADRDLIISGLMSYSSES